MTNSFCSAIARDVVVAQVEFVFNVLDFVVLCVGAPIYTSSRTKFRTDASWLSKHVLLCLLYPPAAFTHFTLTSDIPPHQLLWDVEHD